MKKKIKVGTRKSLLARTQTGWVMERLAKKAEGLELEEVLVQTQGDKILDTPLFQIGDKGLFTKELDHALLAGDIDFAVHSLKDLPTQLPSGLVLAGITERRDPRDVLVSTKWKSLEEVPAGAKIGTGSLRRRAQLLAYRPDFQIQELRGNVDTRLRKLEENGWDGIILAGCGLERAGYSNRIQSWIEETILLPAVGQGSLALVCSRENKEVRDLLSLLDHLDSRQAVLAERAFLRALEGGCQVPIGALARIEEDKLVLKGLVASRDGRKVVRGEKKGPKAQGEELGVQLAEFLLSRGAREILAEYR